jgi:bacterial nucleoid DNA-binding protein
VKKNCRLLADMQIKRIFALRIILDELNFKYYINMTKADIVSEIAKSTGVEKVQVQAIVEAFMESIKTSLTQKNNVYLRGFGSFIVKKRAKKVARNISKNTTITIPEHNIPAFKPAKSFAAKVK